MTPTLDDFRNKDGINIKEEIVNGETFYIVSYMFNDSNLWKDPVNLEARGITFDSNGNIVCRPFEKFFNINENQFTQLKDLNFSNAHYYDKLDGSMITGVLVHEKLFFKSKKSFYSDVALECQKHFANDLRYISIHQITKLWRGGAWTPIFEFTSPMNMIVIDYGIEPKLTLLAIRNNITGEYISYDILKTFRDYDNIPVVEEYDVDSIQDILSQDIDGREGYVIELATGQRVKAKFPSYLTKHRTLDSFNAKNLAMMVIDELSDDMKPYLSPERLLILETIEDIVHKEFDIIRNIVYNLYQEWQGMELREIGIKYNTHPQFHPAIQIFKGKDDTSVLKKYYKDFRIEQFSTRQLWVK
jgi:RNA ligase